jgi:hypothetical protein
MKINLNEKTIRALARNILFESNEKINLHEMSFSPDKTEEGNSNINTTAHNKRADIFKKGPKTSSIKKQKEYGEKEFEIDDELPINDKKYGGNISYEMTPNFYETSEGDVENYLNDDDFYPKKAGLPTVMSKIGKEIGKEVKGNNVKKYYEELKSLSKKYLKDND